MVMEASRLRAIPQQETSEGLRRPRVVVVIVNYNTSELLIDCLHTLAREVATGDIEQVIAVDNASPDASAARLAEAIIDHGWGRWTELLPLPENHGYAAGNNAALRQILAAEAADPPDYILLLNPDTLVRPGAIRPLVEFLENHPRAGMAGSRLEDPDGSPQRSAFRFPGVAGEFENGIRLGIVTRLLASSVVAPPVRNEAHPADWLAGASLLVRREVFEQIGLLDDGYFLYFEEVDFCRRARAAGWESWYVPSSRVVHLVGQATGVTDRKRLPRRVPGYWFEARKRYFRKHGGLLTAAAADLAWSFGFALWRVRRWVLGKPDTDPPNLLADFVRHAIHSVPRPARESN